MKILLALLFALLLAAPASAVEVATDDFNRADENPLDNGDWVTIPGGLGDLKIVGNEVRAAVTSSRNGAYNVTAVGDDQYSQATIISSVSGNSPCVTARVSAVDETYYAFCPFQSGGSDAFDLFKRVGGTYTSLDSDFSAWANGDVIRIDAEGTTIRAYIGGVMVASVTDASITTGQFGILINASGTLADSEIDDWSGGNFASPPSSANFFARRRAK